MSSISTVGSGGGLSHQPLLQTDSFKDDAFATGHAEQRTDQPALDTTNSAIDDKPSETQAAGASSQNDLLSKINTLITNEVNSGKLANSRADTLRNVFANAFAGQSDSADTTASSPSSSVTTATSQTKAPTSSPSSSTATSSTGASHDVGSILNDFMTLLRDAKSTAATYGASGSPSPSSSDARLINYRA